MGESVRLHSIAAHSSCKLCPADGTCLDDIRLFAGLPLEAREELVAKSRQTDYPAGSILVSQGDPITSILLVRKGRIKTFRLDSDGEEYVLDVLHDGQSIWHGVFLKDAYYHYSVGCLTPVSICAIKRSDFEALLAQHPEFAYQLLRVVSAELSDAEEKIVNISMRDPKRRLAEFLLRRDKRCMGTEIHMKLNDIASSVGLRPETVSRILTEFERQGLLRRTGRGRLELLKRKELAAISGSDSRA